MMDEEQSLTRNSRRTFKKNLKYMNEIGVNKIEKYLKLVVVP